VFVPRLRAGQLKYRGSISGKGEELFLFSKSSGPTLTFSQLPIHWCPGSFLNGKRDEGMILNTHLYLLLKLE
jgi:hypothetical protein